MPELLNCPFCGGKPSFESNIVDTVVRCSECSGRVTASIHPGIYLSHDAGKRAEDRQAIAAWNTRPAQPESVLLAEAVKVKPLEWEGDFAHTTFGLFYYIEHATGVPGYVVLEKHAGSSTTKSGWETIAEAKAAAQADYEQRIRSALAAPAQPVEAQTQEKAVGSDASSAIRELKQCDEILDGLSFSGVDQNPHGIRDLLSSSIEDMARSYTAMRDALFAADGLLQQLGHSLPQVKNILANHSNATAGSQPHPDDVAVDRFAAYMKDKLAFKRGQGYGGWNDPKDCTIAWLSDRLRWHVVKGDPVDVANFAMMIHQRGGLIE